MQSVWVESVGRGLVQALDTLGASVQDCPVHLWEAPMWPVPAPGPAQPLFGPGGQPVTDPHQRTTLAQRHSTPWGIAWHALECFDYDLNGEFAPWAPPPPFTSHPHWRDLTRLPTAWSRPEILGYIEHCRHQAGEALSAMTDEKAARPLPTAHRYHGQPHAWVMTALMGHTTEHASQIRQFITAAGIAPGAG